MAAKKATDTQTAAESTTEAENSVKKEQAVNSTPKEEKQQETAITEATEGAGNSTEETFIYIGPTTKGLIENTIVKGTKESVEKYLKDVIEEIPQVKMLIVPTENLATNRAKVRQAGTLINKYYNDVLSLSRKAKEV